MCCGVPPSFEQQLGFAACELALSALSALSFSVQAPDAACPAPPVQLTGLALDVDSKAPRFSSKNLDRAIELKADRIDIAAGHHRRAICCDEA